MKRQRKSVNKKQKTPAEGPLWTRPDDPQVPLHPELDAVLQRSGAFLSTVYIDRAKGGCFRYPVGPAYHALIGGLHKRMKKRFFRGTDVEGFSMRKAFHFNAELGMNCHRSSEAAGKKADETLARCIKQQQQPPPYRAHGASPYATAVWDWCKANGYRLILTQLPVVFVIHGKVNIFFSFFCLIDYAVHCIPRPPWQRVGTTLQCTSNPVS
jgi:hypothetical protein